MLQAISRNDLHGVSWIVRNARDLLPTDPAWLAMDDIEIRLEYHRIMKWRYFQEKGHFPEDNEGIGSNDAYELEEYLSERGIDLSDPDWEETYNWDATDGFTDVTDEF